MGSLTEHLRVEEVFFESQPPSNNVLAALMPK